MGWFDKWFGSDDTTALVKAKASAVPQPTAWNLDPMDYTLGTISGEALTYSDSSRGVGYDVLRSMARTPVVAAIVNTRTNQVAEFATPQSDPYSLGFSIRLRDREKEVTAEDRKEIRRLTDWIETCGDPRISPELGFESFLRQITRDSLIFDQACFEVIKNRGGGVAGFVPVDGATIRRAQISDAERAQGRRSLDTTSYVQVVGQKVVAEFTAAELAFGIRRPRTWVKANGYGFPELEELVRTVTALLAADTHKINDYSQGLSTAGILAVKSKMNPQLFRAFRREFYSMLSGAANSRRTPIIQLDPEHKEGLESINLQSNRDWQDFQNWTGYLLKIACAIYQIDAAELGFVFGAEGQTAAMNHQGPSDKIMLSKEKGLRPLLRSMQGWINRWLISPQNEEFELVFGGLNVRTEDEKLDQDIKRATKFMSVNEVRARWDLDPLDSPAADMVLDPTYMNTAFQMSMNDEGEEGEGEGEEGDMGGEEAPDQDFEDFDIDAFFAKDEPAEPEPAEPEMAKGIYVKSVSVEVE